jgi:hypothetical protein
MQVNAKNPEAGKDLESIPLSELQSRLGVSSEGFVASL